RRLTIAFEPAPSLPPIVGDAVQVQQVLLNLLMNAMDAMAEAPPPLRSIAVSTRLDGECAIETSVIDHGPGIPAAAKLRAFEPFFTTKPHGLGLGLSICSSIIRAHGGQLGLANEPGGGLRARFTLPVGRMSVSEK